MNAEIKTEGMDIKVKLSTLWIVVAINVAMADILGITLQMMSGAESEFTVSQVAMLAFAMIVEIPIAMIFLSRVLKYKVNRWANIIASVIYIVFVIVGGSWTDLSYWFFAAVEIVAMAFIIWSAWKWPNPEV
jgi:hypothetical protein